MNGHNNDEDKPETCKSHLARSEREFYRICPSKISKKELEDLYFTVLENNQELKKTMNSQHDKIKILSTKLQRMTAAQKNPLNKEQRDCCSHTKAMVNEHKESIVELRKANERLSERIRVLNMRLCSAKQFMRRSPTTSVKSTGPAGLSAKTSLASINMKKSETNVRNVLTSTNDKELVTSTRSVETSTDNNKIVERPEKASCDENKCRTLMEELKQKIVDLQEELTKTHQVYSIRISRLERDMTELHSENQRVKGERAASEHELAEQTRRASGLEAGLRAQGETCGNLSAELLIEKRKVAELEAKTRAGNAQRVLTELLDKHLQNSSQRKSEIENLPLQTSSPLPTPQKEKCSAKASTSPDKTRRSDDSGFAETSSDLNNQNKDLYNRINHLQEQLAILTINENIAQSKDKQRISILKDPDKRNSSLVGNLSPIAIDKTASPAPEKIADVETDEREISIDYFKSSVANKPRVSLKDDRNIDVSVKKDKSPYTKRASQISLNNAVRYPKDEDTSNFANKLTPIDFLDNVSPEEERQEQSSKETNSKFAKDGSVYKNDFQAKASTMAEENKDMIIESEKEFEKQTLIAPEITNAISENWKKGHRNQETVDELNSNLETEFVLKGEKNKRDSHNSSQIPGPLPVSNQNIEVKKYVKNSDKTISNKFKNIVNSRNQKRGVNKTDSYIPQKTDVSELKNNEDTSAVVDTLNNSEPKNDNPSINNNLTPAGKDEKDSEKISPSALNRNDEKDAGKNMTPRLFKENDTTIKRDTELDKNSSNNARMEICERFARVCSCGNGSSRNVSVFRTCSGTLRFKTTVDQSTTFRRCDCFDVPVTKNCVTTDTQTKVMQPEPYRKRSLTYTKEDKLTFTKERESRPSQPPQDALAKESLPLQTPRAATPDNTDAEISSLTDLPSEREGKSPRLLSPGEHKATSTSESSPYTADYTTLSEGELPSPSKDKDLSYGETKVNFANRRQEPTQRMEEALKAIGEELARCRHLLHSQRTEENKSPVRDASSATDGRNDIGTSIPLRQTTATACIGDAFSPKCVFTLHIGTVVLSDEAVINSRDMSLVLSWKFFDQNITMTRMRTGRVVLFDFSTQYDIKITPQFLDYLKFEQMPLLISEADKQSEPFAICALPLRDALLHTNRRADMSLALMAGPQLRQTRAVRDELDAGDEVGVLDLWCMLRVDPAMLPAVHKARSKEASKYTPPNPGHPGSQTRYGTSCVPERDRDVTETQPSFQKRDEPHASLNSYGSAYKGGYREGPHRSSEVGFMVQDENMQVPTTIRNEVRTTDREDLVSISKDRKLEDDVSETHSTISSWRGLVTRRLITKRPEKDSLQSCSQSTSAGKNENMNKFGAKHDDCVGLDRSSQKNYMSSPKESLEEPLELRKKSFEPNKLMDPSKKSVTISKRRDDENEVTVKYEPEFRGAIQLTVLWLALNEECAAMADPRVQRLYVAYSFLGRSGADLETPVSLPKPKTYYDKCFFNFSKTFYLTEADMPLIRHMATCRSSKENQNSNDCIVLTVVSEPPPELSLNDCEDVGYAYLYLGDVLACSANSDAYTEVVPVRAARPHLPRCGVLAVRLDGLGAVRSWL